MDLRLDVEVPAGTQLLGRHKMDDRWLITVNLDGKKLQLVTYRDPLGKPPRARPARSLRYTCQFGSSARSMRAAKGNDRKSPRIRAAQTCAVWADGKTHLIGEEF